MPTSSSHFLATATNNGLAVPPLDAERFDGSYKHFCTAKRLKFDRELLSLRGRKISLHSLHEEVMNNRAYDIRERGPGFWLTIARGLGLVHPDDAEPASSEVADRLATIYKRYLGEFDTIYVMSYVQELQQRMAHHGRWIG